MTRDYVLDLSDQDGRAPVLSVFGGKITTYRRLAEHAIEKLSAYWPQLGPAWTGAAALPGGDMPDADFDRFLAEFEARRPFLSAETARRLARAYGTCADDLLGGATRLSDLGEVFGADLTTAEVDYLVDREWARSAQDILWRRSKLGLHLVPEERLRLDAYFSRKAAAA